MTISPFCCSSCESDYSRRDRRCEIREVIVVIYARGYPRERVERGMRKRKHTNPRPSCRFVSVGRAPWGTLISVRPRSPLTAVAALTGGAIPACFETMMLSTCKMDTATAVLRTTQSGQHVAFTHTLQRSTSILTQA
jgi:hypothetical protein